jgi:hypothetical protein
VVPLGIWNICVEHVNKAVIEYVFELVSQAEALARLRI